MISDALQSAPARCLVLVALSAVAAIGDALSLPSVPAPSVGVDSAFATSAGGARPATASLGADFSFGGGLGLGTAELGRPFTEDFGSLAADFGTDLQRSLKIPPTPKQPATGLEGQLSLLSTMPAPASEPIPLFDTFGDARFLPPQEPRAQSHPAGGFAGSVSVSGSGMDDTRIVSTFGARLDGSVGGSLGAPRLQSAEPIVGTRPSLDLFSAVPFTAVPFTADSARATTTPVQDARVESLSSPTPPALSALLASWTPAPVVSMPRAPTTLLSRGQAQQQQQQRTMSVLDVELQRTENVATRLAQDANALSQELRDLSSALRGVEASSHILQTGVVANTTGETRAGVSLLSFEPARALEEVLKRADQLPANTSNISSPLDSNISSNISGIADGNESDNATESLFQKHNIQSSIWTLNHKLSDGWTVVFWAVVAGLIFATMGGCVVALRRNGRPAIEAQGGHAHQRML